jgi:predicted component of type VI protein secretion system
MTWCCLQSSASRYHAHVIVGEEGVSFVDLGTVNGTFVNDQLLPPNASFALDGTEEIRIGDARLFFRPAEGTVPQKSEASLVQTRMGLSAVSGLLAELEEPQQTVPPGGRLQMRLIIQNPSDAVRLCEVELAGMESKWASTNRREVRLEAQESTEVLISVHPPRAYDTKPGRYELAVKVTPHDDPDKTIHQTRFIDVVDFHGLGM